MDAKERVAILLDCTLLSNFARVGRIQLLEQATGGNALTTPEVMKEFKAGVDMGYFPANHLEWLPVVSMSTKEQKTYRMLHLQIGSGEASCLAIAQHRKMTVASDDSDARRYAQQSGIPITGTLGILVHLIRQNILLLPEGNQILQEMVRNGYYAPMMSLEALIS